MAVNTTIPSRNAHDGILATTSESTAPTQAPYTTTSTPSSAVESGVATRSGAAAAMALPSPAATESTTATLESLADTASTKLAKVPTAIKTTAAATAAATAAGTTTTTTTTAPTSPTSPRSPSRPKSHSGGKGTMNGPLYMQTSHKKRNVILMPRSAKKETGTWSHLADWFVENQIGLSFNLLALLFLAHVFIPRARVHTRKFFTLSYHNPETDMYGIGKDDAYLVAFCVVVFTGVRASVMEFVLAPLAKRLGAKQRKIVTRFSEQAWMLTYILMIWPFGMYIYRNSSYWLNLEEMWTNWPQRELGALMKCYLLIQWAFWVQQILVINIEEKRKDYYTMLSHHIITIGLIVACYCYSHTRVGNVILVIMDPVDVLLPLAKCLKYVNKPIPRDITFGLFIITWAITRNILYPIVVYSVYRDSARIPDYKCWKGSATNLTGPFEKPEGWGWIVEPFFDTEGITCFNNITMWAFLIPLLVLQVLMIVWSVEICNSVVKAVRSGGAEDTRSDVEEEEEEEEEGEEGPEEQGGDEYPGQDGEYFGHYDAQSKLHEKEVGVDELSLRAWERRQSGYRRQPGAAASGVSLPGHSDRKELLGRIGCDKHE